MRVSLLPFVFLATAAAPLAARPAHAELAPIQLRCEYQENPLGLDETSPRLFWQLQSRERGQRQSAYQVLVSASPDALKANRGDLWDTGKVSSDRSTHLEYAGRGLESGQRCYWKVRVWDGNGKPSAYSRPAHWEMGLLKPTDWNSKWIGLPRPQSAGPSLAGANWFWFPEGNPAQNAPQGTRYFRRVVNLPARPGRSAVFLLAADNEFVLWVNGKEAGRGGGWQNISRVEVGPLLKEGANVFAIQATNADGPAGLLARLSLEGSGAAQNIDLDPNWKVLDREAPGWKEEGFNDSAWPAPKQIARQGDAPWGPIRVVNTAGGPSPHLRKTFAVGKSIARARVYATALGVYQLHVNGKRVGDDLLSPGWTDYRKRVQYQTYDVTPLLRRGENAFGAIVGDGWYAGSLGFDLSRNHFGPDPSRFRAELHVTYTDGSQERIPTDETWQGRTGAILDSDLYGGETYDARLAVPGFTAGATSAASGEWQPVRVYTDQNPALNARVDPPIRVTQELKTRGITQPKPGVYVFDLGQNMVGMARLKVRGPAGTRVTLRFAEVLNPDGTVYRDNLRLARATDNYILRGGGEEVWEPHFTYHGFRYVEVTGFPGTPTEAALTGRVFHSAMTPTSRFESSSELANRLYRNITWGQRANLMSVPTDCPQRDERLGWMGDAQLFARTSCWNMDMAAFYTKWARDIMDAQSAEGGFSDVSPRVVDNADGAPAWAEAGLVIPWTLYECYGDTRILARHYDSMKRYVDLLHRANPDLLWLRRRNNDFGDWVPAGEQTNKDLIACAYFAFDARLLSRMAAALGKDADAKKYRQLADQITAAFNKRFLSPEGRYLGGTQSAYAIPLGLGLVPPDRQQQVGQRLAEAVRRRGNTLSTGFIGTTFLLPALSDTGHGDLAYQLLLNTRYPSWGYMIEKGATTIWELWNSDTQGPAMNSRNHFAFGTVAEWMQRYLGGIDIPANGPGYRRILIRPRPGADLTHARTEYDSPQGTIVTEWRRTFPGLALKVTVPANTTALVYLPSPLPNSAVVTEGERIVWNQGGYRPGTPGITTARAEGEAIVLEVGSGTYEFQLR